MDQEIMSLHNLEQVLDNLNKKVSSFFKSLDHENQEHYEGKIVQLTIQLSKITALIANVKNSRQVLKKMGEGKNKVSKDGCLPQIVDIVNFYNQTHDNMYNIIWENRKNNQNFEIGNYWKKSSLVLQNLSEINRQFIKQDQHSNNNANSTFTNQKLPQQKSIGSLNSHQKWAMQKMQKNLIQGNMEIFNFHYNGSETNRCNNSGQEIKGQSFAQQYNLDRCLFEKMIPEFERFVEIKKQMQNMLDIFNNQKTTKKTISQQCEQLMNQIKQKMANSTTNKLNYDKKMMIKDTQKQIITGAFNNQSYFSWSEEKRQIINDILSPMIEDYQTVKQIRNKLYLMWDGEDSSNKKYKGKSSQSMSKQAFKIVNKIYQTFKQTENQVTINPKKRKGLISSFISSLMNDKKSETNSSSHFQNSNNFKQSETKYQQLEQVCCEKEKEIRNKIEDQVMNFIHKKQFSLRELMKNSSNIKKDFEENIILMIMQKFQKEFAIQNGTIFQFVDQKQNDYKKLVNQIKELDDLLNKDGDPNRTKCSPFYHQSNSDQEVEEIMFNIQQAINNIKQQKQDLQKVQLQKSQLNKALESQKAKNQQKERNIQNQKYKYQQEIKAIQFQKQELQSKVSQLQHQIQNAIIQKQNLQIASKEQVTRKQEEQVSKKIIATLQQEIEEFVSEFKAISKEPSAKSLEDVKSKIKQFYKIHEQQGKLNEDYIRKVMTQLQKGNNGIVYHQKDEENVPKISIEQMKNKIQSEFIKLSSGKLRIFSQSKLSSSQHSTKKIETFIEDYLGKGEVIKYVQLYSSVIGGDINQVIKSKPNTLTFIKTKRGYHYGCFSSLSHCGKFDGNVTKGLLISDTFNKAFPLKVRQKPLKLDEEKFIFGNNQLVLNKNESQNFCIIQMKGKDAAFDVGKAKNSQFTGSTNNKVQIVGFEVYQVILKNFKQINVEVSQQMNQERKNIPSQNNANSRESRIKDNSQNGKKRQESKSRQKSSGKNNYGKQDIERYKKTISTLKAENQTLKAQVKQLSELNLQSKNKLTNIIDEMEEQQQPLEKQKDNQKEDNLVNNNQSMITQLRQKLNMANESEKQAKEQLQYKTKLIQNLQERQQQIKRQLKQLKESKQNTQISLNKHSNIDEGQNEEMSKLLEEIGKLKQQIMKLKAENKELNKKIGEIERTSENGQQIQKMQMRIGSLRQEIESENKILESIKKQVEQYEQRQNARKDIKQDIQRMKQQQNSLKGVIKLLTEKKDNAEKKQEKQKQLEAKVNELQEQRIRLQQKNEQGRKMMEDIEKQKVRKAQLQNEIKQKLKAQQQIQKQILNSQNTVSDLQKEQLKITNLVNQANDSLKIQNKKIQELKSEYKIKQDQMKVWQQKIKVWQSKYDTLKATQSDLEYVKGVLKTGEEKKVLLQKEIQNKKEQLKQVSSKLKQVQTSMRKNDPQNKFFVGSVIDHDEDKHFIINELYNHYKQKKVSKTKLLFSYPLMHGLDPHNLVDNNSHYILLIRMVEKDPKTGKNYVIGCYSENPLIQKGAHNDGIGFVSSVTNEKTFYLRKDNKHNPRLTEYDPFHFIYGNSQIRFKINQLKLEANIGHNFRSFDTGNMKDPEVFIGHKSESGLMQSYEVFQIIFENSKY